MSDEFWYKVAYTVVLTLMFGYVVYECIREPHE